MQIKHVAVVGSGTMGSGIAQVAATAGCSVLLYDTNAAALSKAEQGLKTTLVKLVEKGKLDESKAQQIQENIRYTGDIKDLKDSELIIEAIIENLEVKRSLFKTLEGIVSSECILASNTSSLSIASIAASVSESGRVVGIHFFNPAPLMQLVEVIPAVQTNAQTIQLAVDTIAAWNKVVAVAKDTPGFIVNRVARPFYSEALRMVSAWGHSS
jgi:3-hydroxybutyryl-CoA dehydrogenase